MTENHSPQPDADLALTPAEPEKKPGLIRGAKELLETTWGSLKGRDINQAVEEFTGEMTLVAEGLSEDQAALRRDVELAAAQLTLLEEDVRGAARHEDVAELAQKLTALQKRLEALEKPAKAGKKERAGLMGVLRQATWMVGFVCIAWVAVTLLRMIGG